MDKHDGFLKIKRQLPDLRQVSERVSDYHELYVPHDDTMVTNQSNRCMNCGVSFCHSGCPLGNYIPDFNAKVAQNKWQEAYQILKATNNFPEFTGRICPAPCEGSCVLGINNDPVTIEFIEKSIIEMAFDQDWVHPSAGPKNGLSVAIVGSGPAGLAAADQLIQLGYEVTVYEKSNKIGGLLRYGIPDFKLDKKYIDRRLSIMKEAGVVFHTNTEVGVTISIETLQVNHDAIVLACGSNKPRDLNLPGRDGSGVYFAMDFLTASNHFVSGESSSPMINVNGQRVLVIGGGDTGSDCIGTSLRQGAASVTQLEIQSMPALERTMDNPWPQWPMTLRSSTSHQEGGERMWSIYTKSFVRSESGTLTGVEVVDVAWTKNPETSKYSFNEISHTQRIIPCDIVFIACGFLHTLHEGIVSELQLELDQYGNVLANNYQTSRPGIFVAGDMRRGQSLVVWAIHEGREVASTIHQSLTSNDTSITTKTKGAFELV